MPERTCLACGRKAEKRELLRISRDRDGMFLLDAGQRLPGRGAYVCRTPACAGLLQRKKGLHHGFRRDVPAEVYERILAFVRDRAEVAA